MLSFGEWLERCNGRGKKFHDALADACLDCPDKVKMEKVDPLYKKVCNAYKNENWKELGGHLAERFASKAPGDIDTDAPEESDSEDP